MARKAHAPTNESRQYVERMIANGMTRETIARVIGVDRKTLEKHYGHELDTGAEVANEKVAATLYEKATDPKGGMPTVVAAIFWMKTRARWKEVSGIEHSGPDGESLPPPNSVVILPDNGRDPELVARLRASAPPMKLIEGRVRQLAPPDVVRAPKDRLA
ncbi:MAG: hypothetical protein ABSF67_03570 [Roseiarcus sp.]|jgi:hypothetical protein